MTATVGNWALFTDFNYLKCVFACMYVCAHHMYLVPLRKEEGFPGTGVTEGYEPPRRCEEPNLGVCNAASALYCWALFPPPRKMSCFFLKNHITIVSNILNVWSQQKSEVIISISFTSESHSCYSEFGSVLSNYGLFPWYPIVQFCFFAFKDFSWEASADLAGLLGASMLNEGKCCAWR